MWPGQWVCEGDGVDFITQLQPMGVGKVSLPSAQYAGSPASCPRLNPLRIHSQMASVTPLCQIERAFGSYTKDTKAALERGSAL